MYWYFARWGADDLTARMLTILRRRVRAAHGRNEEPSAGIIDSQSVKGADTVPRTSRGYDANKKVNGRKRFIVTATLGLLLIVCVMDASGQDRDGAKTTLLGLHLFTPVRFVYADAGFAGLLVDWCQRILRTALEIVRKAPDQKGFAVIPRRWVVERSLAWLTAHRRLARDYERHPAISEAMVRWAGINGMIRRLAHGQPATHQRAWTLDDLKG